MFRLVSTSALMLALWLLVGSHAEAGFPWFKSQPPQCAYAPQVRKYAVVSPTPAPCKQGVYGNSVLWAEQRPATPAYPWGWFGTRNSPQGWSHTGYYGEYSDHGLLREQ